MASNKGPGELRGRVGNVLALLAQQTDTCAAFEAAVEEAIGWVEEGHRDGASVLTAVGRLTVALADNLAKLKEALKAGWSDELAELCFGLSDLYEGVREPPVGDG